MKKSVKFGLLALAGIASALAWYSSRGGSLMICLFLAFVATIIVFQLLPGLSLFVGMLKGLFHGSSSNKNLNGRPKA